MNVPRQAVVLAAGEGRRLRPLTDALPKPLVPFLNLPLLLHTLDRLRRAGVERVVLNAWHRAELLVAFAASEPVSGLRLEVVVERDLLGTGGGLAHAARRLDDGPLLALAGDVVTEVDLPALARTHAASGAIATMALSDDADPDVFGAVECDPEGLLTDIVGRVGRPGVTRHVNASVHLVERAFVEALPHDRPACLVRDGYLPLLERGARCAGYLHPGTWAETGTPRALLDAQARALAGELPVHPELLARGGRLLDGPALVADGARVARDAELLDGTTVGAGAVVSSHARLERCLVMPGAHVPAGARLCGAVVSPVPVPPGVSSS
ncbi:MAG: NDP-sugar synthase [Planctomycetes bacterium]|nr:NDP-sugar synthase [Planctomycetota bacterium]